MPQSCPGVPERIACGGYSVQPAPVGPPGAKKLDDQHQDREQVDPVAQHVDIGEHHVPGADHQRDQVVAEAAEEQRRQQIDHHDHAVHGDELEILVGIDEGEGAGKSELQPHQPRQHQRHHSDGHRRHRVLDGDDLGVLRKDVARPPALRMIELDVRHFGGRDACDCVKRDIDHRNYPPRSSIGAARSSPRDNASLASAFLTSLACFVRRLRDAALRPTARRTSAASPATRDSLSLPRR